MHALAILVSVRGMDEPRCGFGAWIKAIEVTRPLTEAAGAQPFDAPALAVLRNHASCSEHVLLGAGSDEGERRRSNRELEQPPAQRRDVVVVALGRGLGNDVGLPVVEPELPIELARLLI